MQAIVLESFGGIENLHLRDCPLPDPGTGEVRVRILAAAVNPVDFKIRQGRLGGELPMILGHDFAGIVDEVGRGVTGLEPGDAVYGYLGGPKSNGTFAEYACAPAAFVRCKPAALSFAEAAHILRYRGLSVEQLAERVLGAHGGAPVRAAFDFVGGDMKRLCCAVIGFEGDVVSTVEEPEGFDLPLFDGRRSPLFARSASFHFEFLGARARAGGPADWQVYADRLDALTVLLDDGILLPPRVTEAGPLTAKAVGHAHELLERSAAQGKPVITVAPEPDGNVYS